MSADATATGFRRLNNAMETLKSTIHEPSRLVEISSVGNVAGFPGVIGTFMGRDALSLAISYLDLTADDTVLLPVYTCQDVLRSFVRKCNVVFYDIAPDLTINPDELRARLNGKSRVRMMLITNYFGFLQPYREEIDELCAQRDICLIEDCAHSLLTPGSGETGDMAIHSFRKILPIRDGGGLGLNGKCEPPALKYHHKFYSDALSLLACAKSLLKIRTEKFSRARIASHKVQILPLPAKENRILPLSSFAHRKLGNLSFAEIVQKRREDYQFWQEVTRGNPSLTPIFGDLPPGVCPFGFALRTKERDSLETRALEKGIQLRVHWRLDSTLGCDCTTSHQLSKEMLTLPLYPELSPKERELLSKILTPVRFPAAPAAVTGRVQRQL